MTLMEALKEHQDFLLKQLERSRIRVFEAVEVVKSYENPFWGNFNEVRRLIEEMDIVFAKYEHLKELKEFLRDKDL